MQQQMSVQDIYLNLTAVGEAAALKVQNFNPTKSKKMIVSLPKIAKTGKNNGQIGKNAGKKWMINRKTGKRTRVCASDVRKYIKQGYVLGMK